MQCLVQGGIVPCQCFKNPSNGLLVIARCSLKTLFIFGAYVILFQRHDLGTMNRNDDWKK